MNRQTYCNYVEEQLSQLAYRIEVRSKLNILDLNIHSENFYTHLFNKLFKWNLSNLNLTDQNAEAIDLIDNLQKILIQVSSTATKSKVESALEKDLKKYTGYSFKFISISKDAGNLRDKTYKNPNQLSFNPKTDIYDVPSIIRTYTSLDIESQKEIFDHIKLEFQAEIEPIKTETNLANIINILSQHSWTESSTDIEVTPYDIGKKIDHNDLNDAKDIIDDYKIHYHRLDSIYKTFDTQGKNKSLSVLSAIRNIYIKNKGALKGDQLFFEIISCVEKIIQSSANYTTIPQDELSLCVNILVVDTFIRCKIFKNPERYELNANS
ncbi:ABC-three component system protein [Pseudomonas sp. GW458-11-11-14-TSB1]|uniref:ABC-three component system protein n=1 Tax=Pseudomonas sp. GW458-11-11-14-TSB1 TaxID=2751354 RepID=UPI001A9338A6|nr:ABC-three component system protein [Pseudomonas sp. GW458-11-11-14-TSB1]